MRDIKDTTVLIVDDEADLRYAIAFDFKRRGFNVLEAENGRKALDVIRSQKVDLVMSDVRMPGGDGIELLDVLRETLPDVPVVMFITAFNDLTLEQAYERGAETIFSKPFDRKALMEAVISSLSKDAQWRFRASERIPVELSAGIKSADQEDSLSTKVLNLGKGGFFMVCNGVFPKIGSKVLFSIEVMTNKYIEGQGVVRWVRSEADEYRPTGCGIQFDTLDEANKKLLLEVIDKAQANPNVRK